QRANAAAADEPQVGACGVIALTVVTSRARRLIQRLAQPLRQLQGVVVRPEVHEEQPGLLGQHVAVDRRDLDPVRPQGLDHRVDLLANEHEVARDRSLAAAARLEVDSGGDTAWPWRNKRYSMLGNGIAPRYRKLENPAIRLTFAANN